MGWNAKLQIERKRGRGNSGREGERRSRCYAFGLSYCVWVTSSAPDRGSGLWCNASARRVPETQRTSPYDQNASLPGCLPSTHRPRATRRRKQRKRAVRALPGASQPANTAFPLPLRRVVRSTLPPAVKYGRGKRADAEHVGASEPTAPGRRGGGRSPPTLRRRTKRPPPPFLTAHAFVPLCASPAAMGTEVLRPHDCLARSRRPLRPAGMITEAAAASRRGHGSRSDCQASAAAAPRQVRTKVAAEAYAGPAFGSMSPSPRALPLPRFSSKAAADASVVVGVDDSATRELRRLLGLH
jgi:hypothetical protein